MSGSMTAEIRHSDRSRTNRSDARESASENSGRVRPCDARLIAIVVLGGMLGFGGAAWWFRPFLVRPCSSWSRSSLQYLAAGTVPLLKSPLTVLGLLALVWGCPACPLARGPALRISPVAHDVYAGASAHLAHADDPEADLPEAPGIRSPASLDRSATLRWLVSAAGVPGDLLGVSHFTDRLGRLYLVWGVVFAGFMINAALAIVQITNRSEGFYGLFVPGSAPGRAPTMNDLLETPRDGRPSRPDRARRAGQPVPCRSCPTTPFLFGTMIGGSGAFLVFGTLAMPLAMAIILHLVSPREAGRACRTGSGNPAREAWCSCS